MPFTPSLWFAYRRLVKFISEHRCNDFAITLLLVNKELVFVIKVSCEKFMAF